MTITEAIEAAYGEDWDKVKNYVDANGWFNCRTRKPIEIDMMMKDFNKYELKQELINGQIETYLRPTLLKGIENNNGWISVNDKMPTEIGMYFIVNNEGEVTIELAIKITEYYNHKVFYHIEFMNNDKITHWQPIIKPKPPIYLYETENSFTGINILD